MDNEDNEQLQTATKMCAFKIVTALRDFDKYDDHLKSQLINITIQRVNRILNGENIVIEGPDLVVEKPDHVSSEETI